MSYRDFKPDRFHTGLLSAFANWAGAVVSVFLVVGLVFWGYKLAIRDVTEVPVVRAMEGPLRIQPNDPGGEIVAHQGLAVNSVQSEGKVQTPPDTVVLAPAPIDLTREDMTVTQLRPQLDNLSDVSAQTDVDARAAIEAAVLAAVTEANAPVDVRLAAVPGVKSSPRPRARIRVASAANAATDPATAEMLSMAGIDVDPVLVTSGTKLVQLGAFDDRASAIKEWQHIVARHGDLIGVHKRFIQEAESGGRKFYRLRMVGFESLGDSRRLCSALLARGTPCIPVTAR